MKQNNGGLKPKPKSTKPNVKVYGQNPKGFSELLQEKLRAFLDGLPSKLVDNICQAVVNYYKEK